QLRIGLEPELFLDLAAGTGNVHGAGEDHAIVRPLRLYPARGHELAVNFACEHGFQILAPAGRNHHIADVIGRVHTTGDAGEDDGADVEIVERELRRHGRIDHADARHEE